MILNFIIFGSAFCIKVFLEYRINYLYIFQIDPNHKMTPWQLYKISGILYFIFITFYTLNMIQIKLDYAFSDNNKPYFVMALIIAMILYCLQPFFQCGYRTARLELGHTLLQIFISPFGTVRFKDFFFADVITSMG